MTITMTPGQMESLGFLVRTAALTDPTLEGGEGRWAVEQMDDGDLRVRDVERDFYLSPGGGIR